MFTKNAPAILSTKNYYVALFKNKFVMVNNNLNGHLLLVEFNSS